MANETDTEVVLDAPENPVEIVAEQPKKAEPAKTAIVTADEGVEDLKAQVARARADSDRRLSEASRQIEEARQRAMMAEREAMSAKTGAVSTLVESLVKDRESAKRDYSLAMQAGDYDKAADAQARLAESVSRLVEAEKGKVELEAASKSAPQTYRQPVQTVNDPVEEMARAVGGRSADWIRSHPDFARDPNKTQQMERAHFAALGEGIRPETDEYFQFVDRKLGLSREPQTETARETSRAPISAPVSRNTTQSPGVQRAGSIRLTPKEVQLAMETIAPLYPNMGRDDVLRKFAAQKEAALKEGQISRRDW